MLYLLQGRASTDIIWNSAWEIWVTSYKVKHTLVTQPSNAPPTYIFKRNNNLGSHKNLCINIYSHFICSHQKLETTWMFSCWVSRLKMWYIWVDYYSAIKRNKLMICNTLDKSQRHCVRWKSQSQKITYCMVWHFIWHSPVWQEDRVILIRPVRV